jgi:hypothetical protein
MALYYRSYGMTDRRKAEFEVKVVVNSITVSAVQQQVPAQLRELSLWDQTMRLVNESHK